MVPFRQMTQTSNADEKSIPHKTSVAVPASKRIGHLGGFCTRSLDWVCRVDMIAVRYADGASMTLPQRARFLLSLSGELYAQSTRVRDLIGNKHWLSDGHHKEHLLKHLLARYLPSGIEMARGFVVHPTRSDLVSREQDLLFLETNGTAPVFNQGGLCIGLPEQVVAAVAIKTTFGTAELADACATLYAAKKVSAFAAKSGHMWTGLLFFEEGNSSLNCNGVASQLRRFVEQSEPLPGMSAIPDVIAVIGQRAFIVDVGNDATQFSLRGFSGDGTVVLLHSLLSHLAQHRGSDSAQLEQFVGALQLQQLEDSPALA